MDNQNGSERPQVTLPGKAPVAIQHGRRGDRIVLAKLRTQRRWLVRDRDKAGLVPVPPRPARGSMRRSCG
jgi:hypothetical protein